MVQPSKSGYIATAALPAGLLTELLVEGVIGGVGNVVVFLPQILLLFFCCILIRFRLMVNLLHGFMVQHMRTPQGPYWNVVSYTMLELLSM